MPGLNKRVLFIGVYIFVIADNSNRLKFFVEAEDQNSSARACTFTTLHNTVHTPVFMPVATLAVLRSQDTADVDALGFPVLLANTYHLLLRPGTDVFEKFGGIHSFMNWKRSVLTDSGGYQVFSLAKDVKITEDGAVFRSYLDGSRIVLSPETSIATQRIINSDIMMVMDQCVPSLSDFDTCGRAADITARWAERSLAARGDSPQSLFGIVQGACFPELRRRSAGQITSLPFDGFAIGGLAVGEEESQRKDMTELAASLLPRNYPRYLMGVGTPIDLLEAVRRGVDMFDCILPTAMGQQGVAYTSHGKIELRRGVYRFQQRPLDESCSCAACRNYSRAYLHHLVKSGEYYASQLVGLHNLTFYKNLMDSMRGHILSGTFMQYYSSNSEILAADDVEHPVTPPKKRKHTRLPLLGDYEIVRSDKGFHSIRHTGSGEVMHSVNEPLAEAIGLYISQSEFEAAIEKTPGADIVIWDVGLGAGTNAMAAIFEWERIFSERGDVADVKIISFENNLDSLRLAAKNPALFNHTRHAAPTAILRNGLWRSDRFNISWELIEGDFVEKYPSATKPDLIYYDPFSLRSGSFLWGYELFEGIFSHCNGKGSKLFTYSNSTVVRGALLAAGFYTGVGNSTGAKPETTAAFTSREAVNDGIRLLGAEWLERFQRSSAKFIDGTSDKVKSEIERRIFAHPQFGTSQNKVEGGNG